MSYKLTIYQLNEQNKNLRFLNYQSYLTVAGCRPGLNKMDMVWQGETETVNLEMIYQNFNLPEKMPPDYKGASLSVGDIVVLEYGGFAQAFFCESFGFKPVPWIVKEYKEIEKPADINEKLPPNCPRLFVDLDGTLAVFNRVSAMEQLYEKHYFRTLKPINETLGAIKNLYADKSVEIFTLSAYLSDSKYALTEKQAWLDEHLPQIDESHRLFIPCGESKSSIVPGGINSKDFLLDDYTKNLNEWSADGGTGIKLLNGINHTNGTWKGLMVSKVLGSQRIAEAIEAMINDCLEMDFFNDNNFFDGELEM